MKSKDLRPLKQLKKIYKNIKLMKENKHLGLKILKIKLRMLFLSLKNAQGSSAKDKKFKPHLYFQMRDHRAT